MACDKITAILRIAKDAGSTTEVSVHGDTVIWHDSNPLGITEEQIATKQIELQADYDAKQYARDREKEYPTWQDQLDDIYHNGVDGWKATIKVTKDKYPKP